MLNDSPKHVLVVDDDKSIRQLVADALSFAGYLVEIADNGLQALQLMTESHADAVLLDLRMPVMDGWTFLQHLRSDPRFDQKPVVLMSVMPELRGITQTLNVQGYISKPFDLHVFLDVINTLLRTGTR